MSEETAALAKRLARETGVSEDQARDLIKLLGYDWPSLVREARVIVKPPGSQQQQ